MMKTILIALVSLTSQLAAQEEFNPDDFQPTFNFMTIEELSDAYEIYQAEIDEYAKTLPDGSTNRMIIETFLQKNPVLAGGFLDRRKKRREERSDQGVDNDTKDGTGKKKKKKRRIINPDGNGILDGIRNRERGKLMKWILGVAGAIFALGLAVGFLKKKMGF